LDTQNLIFRRRRSQKFKKQTEVQNIIEKLKKKQLCTRAEPDSYLV
jgi:hypothetical protein